MNQFQSWYYRQPSALRTILAINVGLYVLAQFLRLLWPGGLVLIQEYFALHATFPGILLQPWQLITYNFLHTGGGLGGLLHIGFNMLWLFWVGREFEEMHGSGRMWTTYLVCGVGGGLASLVLMPLGIFGTPGIPIVGASASVLGLMMTVAILYPYKQIGLLFFGVVRLLWVVVGFLVIDVLINLGGSGVAVTAHWGGALAGYLFAKSERGEIGLPSFGGKPSSERPRRSSSDASPGMLARLESWLGGGDADAGRSHPTTASEPPRASERDDPRPQPTDAEKEVDRILDKISEHGYDALSDEEKRILYEASQS